MVPKGSDGSAATVPYAACVPQAVCPTAFCLPLLAPEEMTGEPKSPKGEYQGYSQLQQMPQLQYPVTSMTLAIGGVGGGLKRLWIHPTSQMQSGKRIANMPISRLCCVEAFFAFFFLFRLIRFFYKIRLWLNNVRPAVPQCILSPRM